MPCQVYGASYEAGNISRSNNEILCFVDRASLYNRVKKTNLMHNLFLVYLVNLYMFQAYLGPSVDTYY
jgi:hypothetical protein